MSQIRTHRTKRTQPTSGCGSTSPSIGPDNKIVLGAGALSYVLSKTHPANVSKTLQASLQNATPEEIRTLSKLLHPLFSNALTEKTCVRCNKEYLESENDEDSCEVPHCAKPRRFVDSGFKWSDDASEWRPESIIYPCCEKVYDAGEMVYGQETCFTTRHTADPYFRYKKKLGQR